MGLQHADRQNPAADERFYFNRIYPLLSSPWKVCLVEQIGQKTLRFGELKREYSMISRVTLSKYLFELERDGFVNRTEYPAPPLRVEYSLTARGCAVLPLLQQLIEWGVSQ